MGAAAKRPTGAETGTGKVVTNIPIQGSVGCGIHCILLHLFTEDNCASAEGRALLSLTI